MRKNIIDFMLGADPEFCSVEGGSICSPEVGDEDSTFGVDGSGEVYEIRPKPSNNPLDIVKSIHDTFTQNISLNPDLARLNWRAGAYFCNCPMGGHIHFGLKGKVISTKSALPILDSYVGLITILMEKNTEGDRRRSAGYGQLSDFRPQSHGFEYRTPSSWLVSPYVAAAILCLSKTVMFEAVNNSKFNFQDHIKDIRTSKYNSYYGDNEDVFDYAEMRANFPKVWADIKSMKLYQKYKPYLDLIYFIITNKLSWTPRNGMKQAWGLINLSIPPEQNKVELDVIWERYNLEQSTTT